jgi:hypothetical protein
MICVSIWWFFCHCLQSLTLSANALLTIILTLAISLYVLRNDNILLGRCVGISAHKYSFEQQEGMEMNDISCKLKVKNW